MTVYVPAGDVQIPFHHSQKLELQLIDGFQRKLWIHTGEFNVPGTKVLPDLRRQKQSAHEDRPPRACQERHLGPFHQSLNVNETDDRTFGRELYCFEELVSEFVDFFLGGNLVLGTDLLWPKNHSWRRHWNTNNGALVTTCGEFFFRESFLHGHFEQSFLITGTCRMAFEALLNLDNVLTEQHGHTSKSITEIGSGQCSHSGGHLLDRCSLFCWFVGDFLAFHAGRVGVTGRSEELHWLLLIGLTAALLSLKTGVVDFDRFLSLLFTILAASVGLTRSQT